MLTPVVYLDQQVFSLADTGLTIVWKKKEGIGQETGLGPDEFVGNGILTVRENLLGAIESGMLTYYAYVTYTDPTTGNRANVVSDITLTRIKSGVQGTSAVVMTLFAPEGNIFLQGQGMLPIEVSAYKGADDITTQSTYQWYAFEAGNWATIAGENAKTLLVDGRNVKGVKSFRCEMTFDGDTYSDVFTMMDRADSYQAIIESSAGEIGRAHV